MRLKLKGKAVKITRALAIACAAALTTLLSGCNFIPADPTDLIQTPRLTAEQQAIEEALKSAVKGGAYTLQYPKEGDYRSAFILKDLNKDGRTEALAFYRPQSDNAGTHVMILTKTDGKWHKSTDISGDGNDVDAIDFGDFDGNGTLDIAVGWTQFTTGNNLSLSVYAYSSGGYTKVYNSITAFTKMKLADLDGDGRQDVLMVNQDTVNQKAAATLVAFRNGRLAEVAKAPMDGTVSSYAGLYATKIDQKRSGVLIDGYKGAHQVVTELVYWNSGLLKAPFYDYVKGTVTATLRDTTLTCQDIDGDGVYEIPLAVELAGYGDKKNYDDKLWLVRWSGYDIKDDGITLKTKQTCVINKSQHYWFVFPDSSDANVGDANVGASIGNNWDSNKNITIERLNDDKSWVFKQWDSTTGKSGATLFKIDAFTGEEWSTLADKMRSQYKVLYENGSAVYAVMLNDKAAQPKGLALSFEQIKSCFKATD